MKNIIRSSLETWLLSLVILGYPLFALIPTIMDKESTYGSIPFRFIILIISLVIFLRQQSKTLWKLDPLLKIFFILYLLRLIFDGIYLEIPEIARILIFFIVVCFVPAYIIGRSGREVINDTCFASQLLGIGLLICAGALVINYLEIGIHRSLIQVTGRLSFNALNPISLAQAASVTLISIIWLSYHQQSWVISRKIFFILSSITALWILILAASRGPVLALGFSILWFLFTQPPKKKLNLLIMIFSCVFLLLFLPNKIIPPNELGARLINVTHDPSSFERLLIQQKALDVFFDSPLIGKMSLIPEMWCHPHNIFIEAAMALGIVGFLVLFRLIIKASQCLKRKDEQSSVLVMLFIHYFVISQLSSALFGMPELWSLIALLTAKSRFFKGKISLKDEIMHQKLAEGH